MDEGAFRAATEGLGVRLSDEGFALFRAYERVLRAWSERVRLVSRGDRHRLRERHFLPSLAVVPHLPAESHALLDLGTGAGFPGIPIKIARRDIEVVLVESARMKALFLKAVCADLGLDGLHVVHARVETLAPQPEHCGRYHRVVARAVGALPQLWDFARPLLAPGGQLLAVKGPDALKEFGPTRSPEVHASETPLDIPSLEGERVLVAVSAAETE